MPFFIEHSHAQDFCTVQQITDTPAGALNQLPTINGDGILITFNSNFNITGGNADGTVEVFLFDTETNMFTQITDSPFVNIFTGSFSPVISTGGTRIAINSNASLVGMSDGNRELFYFDLNTNMFTQVTNGPNVPGSNCEVHDINADGTRISFACPQDINGGNGDPASTEIFLFDTVTMMFTQITDTTFPVSNLGNSINADGTLVAFDCTGDLTGMNADGSREIFLYNTVTDMITQITDSPNFAGINSSGPSINGPGNRIAFQSRADLTGQNPDNNR